MVRQAMLAPLVAGVALLLNSGADAFVPQFAAKPRFGYGFAGSSKMATARQVSTYIVPGRGVGWDGSRVLVS